MTLRKGRLLIGLLLVAGLLAVATPAAAHTGTTGDCDEYDVQANPDHKHVCFELNVVITTYLDDHIVAK